MAYKKLGKLYFDLTPDGLSFQWGEEGAEKLINLGPLNRLAGDEIDRDHSDEDDYVYEDVYDSDSRYSSRDYDDDGYDYDARGGRNDRYDDDYDDRYDNGYDNGYEDDRYDEYDDGYDDRYDQPNDDDPYYQPGMDDEDGEGGYAPGILDTLFDLLDRFPWIVYVLLVLVPPLGIYLLWRQGMFDFTVRTVISVVSGIWMLLILIWIFSGLGGNPQDPTTNPTANINLNSVAPETIAPAATEDPLEEPSGEDIGEDEPAVELPGETVEPTPTALVSAGTLDGTGDDGSAFVFSPTSGAYYHKTGTCSAIGATAVTQVTVDIAASRGQIQCPTCFGSSVYYATSGGKYYHAAETCTNMTGGKPVTKSAATKAGKTPCPECIREFYISSSNAFYHTKSSCSGMTNASQTTINAAKSAGKTACKTCVGSTTTKKATAKATTAPKNYAKPSNKYDAGVIVYAKKGGVNYHRSATCTSSGMSGGQKITLYNAINFGYTACKYCLPDGNDTVYCDQNGKYYHKANSCSAAKNVVKTSLGKALAVGADKCSKCWATSSGSSSSGSTVKQSGPKVYVTKSNNYYHTRKACGGMTDPTKIYLSEALAHNIKACNDCAGQANNAVYATSGDKTYHYSASCSKLKGTPTKGTLAMALADELSACSKCVSTSSSSSSNSSSSNTSSTVVDKSGLSVYITQKGPYYHANTTCDGLGAEEFYKVSLGVASSSAGKDPCPKCCASASRTIYSSGADTRYHYNKNCSLLPGTAKSATLARALMDGLKACSACTTSSNGVSATPAPEIVPVSNSVSGKTVYVTQAGKTYHISKSCSKISKYEVKGISLETAKNYKMSACSSCSSIASRTVYGSGSSKYYHASKKCNGLTYNNSGSLENALLVGLQPCPICISGTASADKATPKPAVKPTATPKPSSGGAADGTTTVYIDLAHNYEIYHKSAKCSKVDEAVGVTLNYVLDIGFKGCGTCNPPTKVK